MDIQRRLRDYSVDRLGGQPVPADLAALLSARWSDAGFANSRRDPGAILGFRLMEADEAHAMLSLLSDAYLTEADQASPDIMANTAAMKATNSLCCFVADVGDQGVVGYWRGPDGIALDQAAIVQLDTEGQYHLLPGGSIMAALLFLLLPDGSPRRAPALEALAELGLSIGETIPSRRDAARPGVIDPNAYCHRLYDENRAKAGLPPID